MDIRDKINSSSILIGESESDDSNSVEFDKTEVAYETDQEDIIENSGAESSTSVLTNQINRKAMTDDESSSSMDQNDEMDEYFEISGIKNADNEVNFRNAVTMESSLSVINDSLDESYVDQVEDFEGADESIFMPKSSRKKKINLIKSDDEGEEDDESKIQAITTPVKLFHQHSSISQAESSNSSYFLIAKSSQPKCELIDSYQANVSDCTPNYTDEIEVSYKQSNESMSVSAGTDKIDFTSKNIIESGNAEVNIHDVTTPAKSFYANTSIENCMESDDSLHSIDPEASPTKYYTSSAADFKIVAPILKGPRISHRISAFNIDQVMSSTIIGLSPEREQGTPFSGALKKEYMTPRAVRDIIPSPNVSDEESDIVQIISDSEDDEVFAARKTTYKQPTIQEMFNRTMKKSSGEIIDLESTTPSNVRRVSLREYQEQKEKVQKLQENVQKASNLLRTIKLTALPDRGKLLTQRHESVSSVYKDEENKLRNMVVDNDDLKSPPLSAERGLTATSWQDLKSTASNVQPKTFGKQAMATHNHMKALTMDRLAQIHGSLKTCPTEEAFEEDPKGILVDLMPHQKHALSWLVWREQQKPSGGILADDMGLGKTLTMIALMLKSIQLEKDMEPEEHDTTNNENLEPDEVKCKYNGGTLVVCPATLISQWAGEIKNLLKNGKVSVEIYHGAKREHKGRRLCKYDMVITTYSIAMVEAGKQTPLYNIKWRRIILDEAHQVRNYKSRTCGAVCLLSAKSRWALTGTPIHNKELDLYALLKYLRCSPFDDLAVWKRWVTNKNTGGQERLNTVMSSLMLRRTKKQLQEKGALNCLPNRTWELIEIQLEKQEMDVYQKILIFSRTLFSQYLHQRAEKNQDRLSSEPITFTSNNDPNSEYSKMHRKLVKLNRMKDIKQHEILVLLLRLRQVCCHPSLITAMLESGDIGDDDDDGADALNILDQLNNLNLNDDEYDQHISNPCPTDSIDSAKGVGLAEATRGLLNPSQPVFSNERPSTKIKAVLLLLKEKVISQGDKAIIVSQWTSLLRLLAIHLENENIQFQQLDGSVPVHKRAKMIETFNDSDSESKVLLLSLTAGGVGLNLVGANHLLLLDLHWNPQLEMQAQDRIYRVGQKKPVYVYKFMAVDTIEQRIKALQDKKKELAEAMLTGAKMQQSNLTLNDLKMLFNM